MLAKAGTNGIDWVRFLPLALFALSGLSPFDLVYGFGIRGPLDVVYVGWHDDTYRNIALGKWVETLHDRVRELTDLSVARRKKSKDKQRERLNRTRFKRVLSKGDVVYLKLPGRVGAFQAS